MLEELMPPTVTIAEVFGDVADVELFPEEQAVIAVAIEGRRREFTTGRHCAHLALSRLGLPRTPLLPGPSRAPMWPPGIVGSITHCEGYRAAAVAHAQDIGSVGIDAEPNQPLPEGVARLVVFDDDYTVPAGYGVHADRLLFCCKEAVYKAWYPLTGRWLGFEDVRVRIEELRFTAKLKVPGPILDGVEVTGFTGRWIARDRLILAAVVVG
ncbi:4'-phosphopantetheinyl transferase [Actinomadura sp. 6N118]|uniref:4'-phosphopantetheinyl transferase n=1 Tax=Actinomadura sp. 6N118 TaxID=3375151 RepID=UPI0037B5E055